MAMDYTTYKLNKISLKGIPVATGMKVAPDIGAKFLDSQGVLSVP
jgi:hypothetical protein